MSQNENEAYTNKSVHNSFNSMKTRYLSTQSEAKLTKHRRKIMLEKNSQLGNDVKHLNEHGYIVLRNLITDKNVLNEVYNTSKSLQNCRFFCVKCL